MAKGNKLPASIGAEELEPALKGTGRIVGQTVLRDLDNQPPVRDPCGQVQPGQALTFTRKPKDQVLDKGHRHVRHLRRWHTEIGIAGQDLDLLGDEGRRKEAGDQGGTQHGQKPFGPDRVILSGPGIPVETGIS
ncbi:hypothetical protein KU6B_01140 [Mameliella alba]|nr:hypothetical protein KU6B_01140 [Mameliella alba]